MIIIGIICSLQKIKKNKEKVYIQQNVNHNTENEELLKTIEQSHQAIVILDLTQIFYANIAFKKLESWTKNGTFEFLKQIQCYKTQDDLEKQSNLLDSMEKFYYEDEADRTYLGIYTFCLDGNSKTIFLELEGQIINWNGEKAIYLHFYDITNILSLERKAQENKYKTMFIRSFSHEVKHPIVRIYHITERISSKFNQISDLEIRKYFDEQVGNIQDQTEQLLTISNQFQDVNQIQSQNFKLKPNLFQIQDLTEEALQCVQLTANLKGIEIKTQISKEIPQNVIGDFDRIKSVMVTLLQNALKYTKQGFIQIILNKSNELHSSSLEQQLINFQVPISDIFLCEFQIIDTGIGIDPERQKYLFNLFGESQALNFSLDKASGSGMGLYLVQQVVKQLSDNQIYVESKVNQGTKFTFYAALCEQQILSSTLDLPLTNNSVNAFQASQNYSERIQIQNDSEIFCWQQIPQLQTRHRQPVNSSINKSFDSLEDLSLKQSITDGPKVSIHSSDGKKQTCKCPQILAVDDDEFVRTVLEDYLKDYSAIYAREGAEALEYVKERMESQCCQKFELIIMDCQMPIMNGWESTLNIRRLNYQGPILGHTAFSNQADIERCLKSGMNQVINKPAQKAAFIKTVEQVKRKDCKTYLKSAFSYSGIKNKNRSIKSFNNIKVNQIQRDYLKKNSEKVTNDIILKKQTTRKIKDPMLQHPLFLENSYVQIH